MINLLHYKDDSFAFHEEAIEAKNITKKDHTYKERVVKLNPQIRMAFEKYDNAFATNVLEAITAIGYSGQEKVDLHKLYSYSSILFQKLLIQLTTTTSNRRRSICANCTISEVNSFDHVLPQGEFAEFVVHPKNLLPSCTYCNMRKNRFWVNDGTKVFLNLYLDTIPTAQFLHADVIVHSEKEVEIQFRLERPDSISNELFSLLDSHYQKLGLLTRFAENSNDVVSEFENEISSYGRQLSRIDIEACAKETISKNQVLYGVNYWKCVVKLALIGSDIFMKRFSFKNDVE